MLALEAMSTRRSFCLAAFQENYKIYWSREEVRDLHLLVAFYLRREIRD
jgi:hypothetical protein